MTENQNAVPRDSESLSFWEKVKRRKLKNYLFLDKELQFQFAYLLAGVAVINGIYFSMLFYFYSQEQFLRLSALIPEYLLTERLVEDGYRLLITTILFACVSQVIFFLILGLFFSHRIAGPLYVVKNKLLEIQKGSIPTPIRLRKHDMLSEFVDRVNETMDALAENRKKIEGLIESDSTPAEIKNKLKEIIS